MSSVSSEVWSGSGLVVSPVHCTHAVDVDHAARNVGEQLRRVEPPEGLLADELDRKSVV